MFPGFTKRGASFIFTIEVFFLLSEFRQVVNLLKMNLTLLEC